RQRRAAVLEDLDVAFRRQKVDVIFADPLSKHWSAAAVTRLHSRGYQRWVGVAEQDPVHVAAEFVHFVKLALHVVPAAKAIRLADVDRLDMDHRHFAERVAPGDRKSVV